MRLAPLVLALLCSLASAEVQLPPAMICTSPPPPGPGAGPDGRAILHIMQTGTYDFYGVTVGGVVGPRYLAAGTYHVVSSHFGALRWVRDGNSEAVPTTALYPTTFFNNR